MQPWRVQLLRLQSQRHLFRGFSVRPMCHSNPMMTLAVVGRRMHCANAMQQTISVTSNIALMFNRVTLWWHNKAMTVAQHRCIAAIACVVSPLALPICCWTSTHLAIWHVTEQTSSVSQCMPELCVETPCTGIGGPMFNFDDTRPDLQEWKHDKRPKYRCTEEIVRSCIWKDKLQGGLCAQKEYPLPSYHSLRRWIDVGVRLCIKTSKAILSVFMLVH